MVIFVASGTNDAILPINYTIFILNNTISIKQSKSFTTFNALSSLISKTIGVDSHAQSLLTESVPLLAPITAIFSVG